MARRFIVKSQDIVKNEEQMMEILGEEVKHIQVLRFNVGDDIVINEYNCKILEMRRDRILLEKLSLVPKNGEPNLELTLYIAVLKSDKLDFVVQKAVELGVKKIIPFFSHNVIVKLDEAGKNKRREKLDKIAKEACKQCGRTDEVEVLNFATFKEVLSSMKEFDVNLFAYEKEKESIDYVMKTIKEQPCHTISCIIGPEGGFTSDEAEDLSNEDHVKIVSLGERILRAETAALNIISIIMYELDK
ncbi:MAG: RsmE family RNA methyltransferase [Clostridia bacterium]|nr:RsmE family RNA methyltransferase [Clostridia bacterium]